MSTDHGRETLKKVVDYFVEPNKNSSQARYIQFFHISLPSPHNYNHLFLATILKLQFYVHEISIRLIIPDIYHECYFS